MLIALLRLGLSYAEARTIGMEEMLCLLHHAQLDKQLAALDQEAARIAGLQFADPHEQQQALTAVHHGARALLDRFHHNQSCGARTMRGKQSDDQIQ
jgi:hypothetical protein